MHIKSFRPIAYTVGLAWVGLLSMASSVKSFPTGDVFASVGNGVVDVYSSAGALLQTLDTGLGAGVFTTGSAFDTSGNFYVTDFNANQVTEFNSSGTLVGEFAATGSDDESIVRDASGNFYVGQAGTNQILKLNSTGATVASFTATTQDRGTDWVDLAGDQHTLYYTSEGNSILRFDTATNTQLSDFATGLTGSAAYALRILGNGDVLVADSNSVVRFNSAGTLVQTYTNTSFGDTGAGLFALNIDSSGTSFWTGDFANGKIFNVDIATGKLLSTIDTGSSALFGLSVSGEITQGGGGGGGGSSVPDGGSTGLLLVGALAALVISQHGGRVWRSLSFS